MSQIAAATLIIKGHFPNDTFPEWIINRAQRLNLTGWVESKNTSQVKIFVSGDPILIDAMEVACSLGPIDAQVDSIKKITESTQKEHYRQPARFVRY